MVVTYPLFTVVFCCYLPQSHPGHLAIGRHLSSAPATPDPGVSQQTASALFQEHHSASLLAGLGLVADTTPAGPQPRTTSTHAHVCGAPPVRGRSLGRRSPTARRLTSSESAATPKRARVVSLRVISRQQNFATLLGKVLDPRLQAQQSSIVRILVEGWNPGTRDNYLQKFEVFLEYLQHRGLYLHSDISCVDLLQFALFLLEERTPTITAKSVSQYLAGVRSVARLLNWTIPPSDFLLTQLLNNVAGGGKQRKGDRNNRYQRVPIVPETMLLVSEALPGVLAGGTQTIPLLRDFLMVVFGYIFGWRESTVATL